MKTRGLVASKSGSGCFFKTDNLHSTVDASHDSEGEGCETWGDNESEQLKISENPKDCLCV